MKKISGTLKLDQAQFREYSDIFNQVRNSEFDQEIEKRLKSDYINIQKDLQKDIILLEEDSWIQIMTYERWDWEIEIKKFLIMKILLTIYVMFGTVEHSLVLLQLMMLQSLVDVSLILVMIN